MGREIKSVNGKIDQLLYLDFAIILKFKSFELDNEDWW